LDAGFARTATVVEYSYILGFSPHSSTLDGSFHTLKVRLENLRGARVEARPGYYAIGGHSPDEVATDEIDDAVFARNMISDIPIVLQTGYSKQNGSTSAVVNVAAKVEIAGLHLEKKGEHSDDSFRAVAVLFDSNGAYVTGSEHTVLLKLRERTLAHPDAGVTLRWAFPVETGRYLLRLVIREAGGRSWTTLNRPVIVQ
jgi:hypothetical protein